jgi:hypothetical protein
MQGNLGIRSQEHRDGAGANVRRILAQRRKEEACRNAKDNKPACDQRTEAPSPTAVCRKATSTLTSREPYAAPKVLPQVHRYAANVCEGYRLCGAASVYRLAGKGQTRRRQAETYLAIRDLEANIGPHHADPFHEDIPHCRGTIGYCNDAKRD